ncbi:MAG: hypothetical protein ACI8VW_000913 [bacterium]|jgi:hypothetical protein
MGRSSNNRVDDDYNDFDNDITEGLYFDFNLDDPSSPKIGKIRRKGRKKKNGSELFKFNRGPQAWDDDWTAPSDSDDWIFGFNDSDSDFRAY